MLILFALLLAGCQTPRHAIVPTGLTFSVMTWNVNWGAPAPGEVIDTIRSADADIVCLQETTPQWERLLTPALADRYAHIAFRHWGGAGGLAVLSKHPGVETAFVESRAGWFPGWIIRVGTPAGPVQLVAVHLRPALADDGRFTVSAYFDTRPVRQREVSDLLEHAEAGLPTVVAGDFNEDEGGSAMRELRRRGFADALGPFDGSADTWRWAVGPVVVRDRLDHILHTTELRCLHARVIEAGSSDHWPVVAVFERR